MTDTYEAIFGIFRSISDQRQEWQFKGFFGEGARELEHFYDDTLPQHGLPQPANYVGNHHAHMMYDLDLELKPATQHIIQERGSRLPVHLHGVADAYKTQVVHAAVQQAIHRTRLNFKTAIPQWYMGRLGLLLPLRLTPDQRMADRALAVSRERSASGREFYRGSTVLYLHWAYLYARLIARPDPEWLVPVAPAQSADNTPGAAEQTVDDE